MHNGQGGRQADWEGNGVHMCASADDVDYMELRERHAGRMVFSAQGWGNCEPGDGICEMTGEGQMGKSDDELRKGHVGEERHSERGPRLRSCEEDGRSASCRVTPG